MHIFLPTKFILSITILLIQYHNYMQNQQQYTKSINIQNKIKISIMGIVSAIQNSCLAIEQDNGLGDFLDTNGKIINDDYMYFQQQNWYRLQQTLLFDPNKFIFLYTNYKQTQLKLINLWRIVDTKKFKNNQKIIFNDLPLQPRWMYAFRKGVPIIYYKNVIEMMFDKNLNLESNGKKYQAMLYDRTRLIGDKIKIVTFQEQSQHVTYSIPFMNKEGIQAAKRIAFLISQTKSQLQKNPYIINIIALLLIFISEADAYDIVCIMIDGSTSMSVERSQALRWHFSLTQNQLQKFAREFYKTVKRVSPSISIINDHLNTEGIQKFEIFKQIIGNFFIGYLPFPIVLRIFIIYLNQGVKAFYRFFYSILKIAGQNIKDCNNTKAILRVIRTKMLMSLNTQKQIKSFFKFGFDLRLQNLVSITIKKSQVQASLIKNQQLFAYYLPEVFGDSQILSYQQVQKVWSFFPDIIKHYDMRKIFSTTQNNPTLKRMIQILQQHSLTLIIVKTTNGSIFGVFFAQKMKTISQIQAIRMSKSMPSGQFNQTVSNSMASSQTSLMKVQKKQSTRQQVARDIYYFGSSESFVFLLRPNIKKYSSSGQNVFYYTYTQNMLIVGGPPDRPALQIDSTLTVGLSYNCPTFNSFPLHGEIPGQFKIEKIQCFSIQ